MKLVRRILKWTAVVILAGVLGGGRFNKADLTVLRDLRREGKVTPVIDRQYRMSETTEALHYLEEGHARGKIAITIE